MKYVVVPFILLILTTRSTVYNYKQNPIPFFYGGDERIVFHGRVDFSDSLKPTFWAPGTYFELQFEGPFCAIYLEDNLKFGTHHNYIEIVLDDQKPRRVRLDDKMNKILIGDSLTDTVHKLLICKNTESGIGYVRLESVNCRQLIEIPKEKKRIIEFIGNSITCGNGCDDTGTKCGEGKWYDQHNAYMAFGPLIARRFNSDWILSAVSGIGLTRNCCGIENTMPEIYDRISFRMDSEKWIFPEQKPDLLSISLGQNDGMQKKSIYVKTYLKFLRELRVLYPNTTIILTTSPAANKRLRKHLEKCITEVIQKVNSSGDQNVYSFFYKKRYK